MGLAGVGVEGGAEGGKERADEAADAKTKVFVVERGGVVEHSLLLLCSKLCAVLSCLDEGVEEELC